MSKPIVIHERELMDRFTVTVIIKLKRDWRVIVGLRLIKFGCWLSNINFKAENEAKP